MLMEGGGMLSRTLQTLCRIIRHALVGLQDWFKLNEPALFGHIVCLPLGRKA